MRRLLLLIQEWAIDRGLHEADPKYQLVKLMEETGELASGVLRNNKPLTIDSIGDTLVVLTILALQLGLDLEECLQYSYDEIKDRKGKTINGVFVKSEDLARKSTYDEVRSLLFSKPSYTDGLPIVRVSYPKFEESYAKNTDFVPLSLYRHAITRSPFPGEMGVLYKDFSMSIVVVE